jgi:hypothetical protein
VIDADTGLPSPCTVTIVDSSGRTILESDSLRTGFRCDGSFKKRLLAGRTRVVVSRGPETRAVEREIDLSTGADAAMEIKLERIVDLRKRGWFAGDSHVHMLHGERAIPVSFDDVARAAKAEDLAFLSLAQDWAIDDPTPEKLSAELSARSSSTCRLTWNLEAPKNYYQGDATRCLGHCWFVGARGRTAGGDDVIRLLAAASAHDYQSEKPTFANFESHRMIHEQGGAVFYTHPARWWSGAWGGQGIYPRRENVRVSNMAVELPLDTLIGPTFDGVDVMTTEGEHEAGELAFKLWCLLVNHGYRMTATCFVRCLFRQAGRGGPWLRAYLRSAQRRFLAGSRASSHGPGGCFRDQRTASPRKRRKPAAGIGVPSGWHGAHAGGGSVGVGDGPQRPDPARALSQRRAPQNDRDVPARTVPKNKFPDRRLEQRLVLLAHRRR